MFYDSVRFDPLTIRREAIGSIMGARASVMSLGQREIEIYALNLMFMSYFKKPQISYNELKPSVSPATVETTVGECIAPAPGRGRNRVRV